MSAVRGSDAERFVDFGPFRLDRRERLLFQGTAAVPLAPKAIDLLVVLTGRPGALLSKDDLISQVWPDVVVEESNLSQNIFLLRKALSDEGGRWIVTVPRRGYRFVGDVKTHSGLPDLPVVSPQAEAPGLPDRPSVLPSTAPIGEPVIAGSGRAGAFSVRRAAVAAVILALAVSVMFVAWIVKRRSDATPLAAPANRSIRSIAVLPFQPIDETQKDRILQLGIADSVINKLSQLSAVAVSTTHAVTPYLDGHTEALAAGRELGVENVLEGSIQRKGPRVRCSVRLLRVADGSAIWADHYDEDGADVFALEDHIAERVATALDIHLGPDERRGLAKRYTNNQEAYDLYLQGRLAWERFDRAGLEASIRYYQAALQKDPRFALAYAGMAKTYSVMGIYGPLSPEESNARSKEAAIRALAIDPQIANAHVALAACAIFRDWDWSVAEEEIHRALEIDPSCDAHTLRGYLLEARGKPDEALYEMRRERDLDPLWRIPKNDCIQGLYLSRRFDEAIAEGSQLLDLDPSDGFVRYFVGKALFQKGRIADEAAEQSAYSGYRSSPYFIAQAAAIDWRRGDRSAATARIAELEKLRATDRVHRTDFLLATIYAEAGDSDAAFKALDASIRARYPFLYEVRDDPSFDSIRDDHRYALFLAKLNLASSRR